MDPKQILIFGLFLVPVWTCMHKCCDDEELKQSNAVKKTQHHYPQPPEHRAAPARDSPVCPVELYRQQAASGDIKDRSLSPWRYVLVTKEDHFPSTYVQAECLCSGCILMPDSNSSEQKLPVERIDYISQPVVQSRVFLKKERCGQGNKFRLVRTAVDVTVGCTCIRPNISS